MLVKMLPGLAIALILGVIFCLPGGDAERRRRRQSEIVLVTRTQAGGSRGSGSVFRLETGRRSAAPMPVAAASKNVGIFADGDILAMAPPAAPISVDHSPAAVAVPINHTPVDTASISNSYSYGLGSDTALASLAGSAAAGVPTAHVPSFAYPTLPPKGIALWGRGMAYDEKKDATHPWQSAYTHKGTVYSAGANYDWSVDSTIGLSIDYLKAELNGRYDADSRQTDTTGYFINAHYTGALCGKMPFSMKAMYGWIEQDASGWVDDWKTGIRFPWNEDKHNSRMFGFSASAIYPLLSPNDYRFTPKVAVDYRNLKTKAFSVGVSDNDVDQLMNPAMTSTSLNFTTMLTTEKDFQQVWGVVTPRLGFGYSYETSDTGAQVRTLNAMSACRVEPDPLTNTWTVTYDSEPRGMALFNAGVDMKILGGWDIAADYERKFARDYSKDTFKLEISRCF